jgi:hypothetical protein
VIFIESIISLNTINPMIETVYQSLVVEILYSPARSPISRVHIQHLAFLQFFMVAIFGEICLLQLLLFLPKTSVS